jgi:hypothetical protein
MVVIPNLERFVENSKQLNESRASKTGKPFNLRHSTNPLSMFSMTERKREARNSWRSTKKLLYCEDECRKKSLVSVVRFFHPLLSEQAKESSPVNTGFVDTIV